MSLRIHTNQETPAVRNIPSDAKASAKKQTTDSLSSQGSQSAAAVSKKGLCDRLMTILSNAWNWIKAHIFCCCSSKAVDEASKAKKSLKGIDLQMKGVQEFIKALEDGKLEQAKSLFETHLYPLMKIGKYSFLNTSHWDKVKKLEIEAVVKRYNDDKVEAVEFYKNYLTILTQIKNFADLTVNQKDTKKAVAEFRNLLRKDNAFAERGLKMLEVEILKAADKDTPEGQKLIEFFSLVNSSMVLSMADADLIEAGIQSLPTSPIVIQACKKILEKGIG